MVMHGWPLRGCRELLGVRGKQKDVVDDSRNPCKAGSEVSLLQASEWPAWICLA